MATSIAVSQSSLLCPQLQPHVTFTRRAPVFIENGRISVSCYKPFMSSTVKSVNCQLQLFSSQQRSQLHREIRAIHAPKASSLDAELPEEKDIVVPDITSGGDDEGSGKGRNDGGSGGDGNGGDGNDHNKDDGESDDANSKMNKALLMSQKFTLAYAALVGLGGFMGYLKSGSQKSLAAGGLSALLLYYVYTELPKRPVFASSMGLGLSAALLVVMGSRFMKSRKVFPAGVVSLVSFIMTGGYVHGIMKTH